MKLNRILCRQEHYQLVLTAAVLLVTYHITKLHQYVALIRLTQTAALETHSSSYILQHQYMALIRLTQTAALETHSSSYILQNDTSFCKHVAWQL